MSSEDCSLAHPSPQMPQTAETGTVVGEMPLFAEYALMLMATHAAFCGLMRLVFLGAYPHAVVGILAAVWIILRTISAVRLRWFFPVITLCIAVAVVLWDGLRLDGSQPEAARSLFSGHFFSPVALLIMLCLLVCGDVADLMRHVFEDSQMRNRGSEFLLRHGLRILLFGIGGFIAVYAFVVPFVQEWIICLSESSSDPRFAMDRLTLSQNMLFKFTESVSGMWFFVVGACVGSFLNVVIYRIPAGLSVVSKASHCPGCQQSIRGRDNLPLIGWLKLQGQCRNCQIEISSRYPTVELTIGLMFLLLYFVELISGGTNLPGRTPNGYAGVLWILFYTRWDLVALYAFHCFVFCALFSWAMIRRDGHRVPLKSVAITLTIAISCVLLQPPLLPWAYSAKPTSTITYSLQVAATSMIVGAIAAVVLQVALMSTNKFWPTPQTFHFESWLLAGMALGWQAIVGVLLMLALWALLQMASRIVGNQDGSSTHVHVLVAQPAWLLLPVAIFMHHCVWRQLVSNVNIWVLP